MPPHSSHLLQPLDVGCFALLKKAYGRKAKWLMRNKITHITKIEFLPCFKTTFDASTNKRNIQRGTRGAGLVPFDPKAVTTKLEVRLRTPLLPTVDHSTWQSHTSSNTVELGSQSTLIPRHQNSSRSSTLNPYDHVAEGVVRVAHKLALAEKEILELRAADEAVTRRRSHTRKQVQRKRTQAYGEGVCLTGHNAQTCNNGAQSTVD